MVPIERFAGDPTVGHERPSPTARKAADHERLGNPNREAGGQLREEADLRRQELRVSGRSREPEDVRSVHLEHDVLPTLRVDAKVVEPETGESVGDQLPVESPRFAGVPGRHRRWKRTLTST
jgi:hypothetical protein